MKASSWYFLILGLCGIAAAAIPWIYNQSQTLDREELARQRSHWLAQEPQDFQLRIQVRDGERTHQIVAKFQRSLIAACRLDGLFLDEKAAAAWNVPALFEQLEDWLAQMEMAPSDCRTTARFHPRLGIPIRMVFVRKSDRRRIEYQIAVESIGTGG